MRNQRSGASSRAEQRKNKTDRFLNWTIGIVSLLILAVGCIILIAVFNTSNPRPAAQPASSLAQTSASSSQAKGSDNSSSGDSSQSGSSQVSNEGSSGSTSSSSSSTVSDENHQASYDIGTADWNAQVQAISGATGISVSDMTIHWLGNGGSPNSSLARVSPKSSQTSIYVVHLIYQGGKWQADNVTKPGQ